ncbi:MAG: Rieske 2Fe-2S domain-containing protein [Bacteroidota bacterium]|nr:Rieske 2Fe-2S domain-containing protein [Bacteroidota bacterium]
MSTAKTYKWIKVAESTDDIEWQQNDMCVIEASGKKISIAKFKGQISAFAYKCPHAGGILADGCLDALGHAVCPIHRYKFELMKGRNVSGEGYYLKIYPVECRPDGVFVGFEEKGFFNWL